MKRLVPLLIYVAMAHLTSCGLVHSDSRKVETLQKTFIATLSADREVEALGYCDAQFTWIQQEKVVAAKEPAKAFFDSVTKTKNFDGVDFVSKSFSNIGKNYLGKGRLVVKQAGATASTSFDVSLLWKETASGWKLARVKELSGRTVGTGN